MAGAPLRLSSDHLVVSLRRTALQRPDREAFLFLAQGEIETERLTYAALDAATRTIAVRLRTSGAEFGDRERQQCPSQRYDRGSERLPGDVGLVELRAGNGLGPVAVPVVGDRVDEPNESFFLNLTLASGSAALLADAQGKGTIWNDDFCQRSPGYWKAHTSLWPVGEFQLFLASHPPGSNPSGADRDLALQLKEVLDTYNNGGCRP